MRFRRLVAGIIAGGILGLVGLGFASYGLYRLASAKTTATTPSASYSLQVGDAVPLGQVLTRLGGGPKVSLSALGNGRPVVISFFASWCPACAAELAAFNSVARAEHGRVTFVGIDTNDDDPAKALVLLHAAKVTYPVGVDTAKLGLASAYGVANLPTTFFVSSTGRLVAASVGGETKTALMSHVALLVKGQSA